MQQAVRDHDRDDDVHLWKVRTCNKSKPIPDNTPSDGRGTCYGDSGGPAIVKQPDGSYVQVRGALCGHLICTSVKH